MNKNLTVKVIELNDRQELFECEIHEIDKAYKFASDMEQMGIDVKIISPSITRELSHSLGVSEEDWKKIAASLDDEIADHQAEEIDSCCANKK